MRFVEILVDAASCQEFAERTEICPRSTVDYRSHTRNSNVSVSERKKLHGDLSCLYTKI